jgi:hypothetical protein
MSTTPELPCRHRSAGRPCSWPLAPYRPGYRDRPTLTRTRALAQVHGTWRRGETIAQYHPGVHRVPGRDQHHDPPTVVGLDPHRHLSESGQTVGDKLRAWLTWGRCCRPGRGQHSSADQHRRLGPRPSARDPQLSTASHGLPISPIRRNPRPPAAAPRTVPLPGRRSVFPDRKTTARPRPEGNATPCRGKDQGPAPR